MKKHNKTPYIVAIIVSLAATIVLAILYTIEINKTTTTTKLIEELLVEDGLDKINNEAPADSLSEVQNFIRSEDFDSSKNYLVIEGEGETANYIVQFRYEENREIRILEIEEITDE